MFMVGFGAAYSASAVLHVSVLLEDAEVAPPRWRGAFMSINVVGQALGWLAAALLAIFAISSSGDGSNSSLWRALFGVGAAFGVLLLLMLPWLPVRRVCCVLQRRSKGQEHLLGR
jgi:MFS family permease